MGRGLPHRNFLRNAGNSLLLRLQHGCMRRHCFTRLLAWQIECHLLSIDARIGSFPTPESSSHHTAQRHVRFSSHSQPPSPLQHERFTSQRLYAAAPPALISHAAPPPAPRLRHTVAKKFTSSSRVAVRRKPTATIRKQGSLLARA